MGRADLHSHTKYSGLSKVLFIKLPDSVCEPADLVRAADAKGLDVLCVTDHNTVRGGLEARKAPGKVEVVVGEEVGTSEGEVLGLFLTEEVMPGMSAAETIDVIHSMGGVAVAPHPFSAHCSALGNSAFDLPLDGVEVFNSFHRDGYSNDIASRLSRGRGKALTGGSDAHAPSMVGNAYTDFDGATAEDLRKAILAGKTSPGGRYTPLKDLIWMETTVALRLQHILCRSMTNGANDEDTIYSREVYDMRAISKVLSFLGIMTFLAPPVTILAGVVGDRLHRSKSKALWTSLCAANGWKA